MGAGARRQNEPGKLEDCGGGRSKEAVKLGGDSSDGSPECVVNIGRSRILVDNLGQLYVPDSEDEGSDMEVGLYAPDSEEEDGGRCGGHQQLFRRAWLDAAHARLAAPRVTGHKHGRAVDAPVGDAAAPDEVHPELKVQLARMDPILHNTFLSFLNILLPACFKP